MLSLRTRKLLFAVAATLTIPLLGAVVTVPGGAAAAVALAAAPPKTPPPTSSPPVACGPDQKGCTASTGAPSSPGNPGGPGGGGGGGGQICTFKGQPVACYDPQYGYYDQFNTCYYLFETPQPPTGDPSREGHVLGDGAVYLTTCLNSKGPGGPVNNQFTTWLPDPPPGQPNAPTDGQRALEVVMNMGVRGPVVATVPRPGPNSIGLVGLPVWLWSNPPPAGQFIWGTHTATLTVPGVTLTVTATAVSEDWDMGQGTVVHCQSTGTPYNPQVNPGGISPDCGFSYLRPGDYTITGSTRWHVTWTATDGNNGTLAPDPIFASPNAVLHIRQMEVVTQ